MVLYLNGQVPSSVVSVVLATGRDWKGRYYEQRLTPQTTACWRYAQAYCVAKWGRKPLIRSGGPNAYRPLEFQRFYYQDGVDQGNPLQAAYPGSSSHGGNWRGRDCLAIDVDPQGLSWGQVWEACRAAGFECGLITRAIAGVDEPWHIIHFKAFGPMPAFAGATPIIPGLLEEDMPLNADTDYEAFKQMLYRALKWDVRDGDKGAGADAKLGMTLWDRLGAIGNAVKAPAAPVIDYDKLAAALASQGLPARVADELAKRLGNG